jgi:voltage-gated potassium channel
VAPTKAPARDKPIARSSGANTRWLASVAQVYKDFIALVRIARQEKLTTLLAWMLWLILACSLVFFFAERGHNAAVHSYFEALYWCIVSVTTVGYGDVIPVTPVGRIAASVMLLSVMALMPLVAAIITSIYISRKIKGERGLERITFGQHLIICGWNNNASNVLAGLSARRERTPVVIIGDLPPDLFEGQQQRFPRLSLHYVRGPYLNEATLMRANAKQAQVAIVLINYGLDSLAKSDDMAVLAVLALRDMCPRMRIIAECFASSNRSHLRRAGADGVVVSGDLDGYMLTAAALEPGLDSSIKDALSFESGSDMWTVPIPQSFIGRTYRELARQWLDEKCWIVIGLVHEERALSIEDVLSGDRSSIDDFILRSFEQAGRRAGGVHHAHHLNPGAQYVIRRADKAVVIFPATEEASSAASG